uniref:F-box domain-containing protein n=1 Tax=Globodera rostochiensis TaxID=31243 RepID=A0A914I1Q4_GLORO
MANAISLNTLDESQLRRRGLPLELQCELFSALPLEHASRLLLLSDRINNNCISHVRKLREKWQEFSGRRVNELVQRYHPRLPAGMRAIEEAHLEINPAAQQEDKFLNETISHDRAKLSPWVGQNSVLRATGAGSRHEVMTELVNSIVNMHQFIEKNKKRLKEADEQYNDVKRIANSIMSELIPHHFPDEMLSTGSDWTAKRLRRDYEAHLGATRARLIELKKAHRKKLRQSGVYKQIYEWSSEVQKHHDIIIAQWKAINMQNTTDKFDATVLRERFLDELKAKNALTIESADGDIGRCACLLRGTRFFSR